MSVFLDNLRISNELTLEFALTDLDLALTFMDIASISKCEETVLRNHDNARKAYVTVVNLLRRFSPNEPQMPALAAKLAILKSKLDAISR